jgi:sugar/nucleoside kinase (ribokinase family)
LAEREYRARARDRLSTRRPPGRPSPDATVEIVHVGSACRDLTDEDARGWRLGGGVTYASLATARLGIRTAAVVGVDSEAAVASELDLLRDAGVDLMLVPLDEGPIYRNVETSGGRVQTCVRRGLPLPVPRLPESWRHAPAWSIAPVAGEIGGAWPAAIPDGTLVVLAWQGLLRNLDPGEVVTRRPPDPSPLLRRADLVGVSHHDVDPQTPILRLTGLLSPGAALVVTQGHEGGLLIAIGPDGPADVRRYRATRADRETDPTGAGDVFLAVLAASAIRPGKGERQRSRFDLRLATAAGSLVVEGPGLAAVPDLRRVLDRLETTEVRRLVVPGRADRVGSYGRH